MMWTKIKWEKNRNRGIASTNPDELPQTNVKHGTLQNVRQYQLVLYQVIQKNVQVHIKLTWSTQMIDHLQAPPLHSAACIFSGFRTLIREL